MRRLVLLAAALLAVPLVPVAYATDRTQVKPYLLGGDVILACDGLPSEAPPELSGAENVGGACFKLENRDRKVTVDIRDATGLRVDGFVEFGDRTNSSHRTGVVCGRRGMAIPEGATWMNVYVHTATAGALGCLVDKEMPAIGTAGEIRATFHQGSNRRVSSLDVEQDCVEGVPAAVSALGITGDGSPVEVSVYVLLDGVTLQRGRDVFKAAAASYAPLNIKLRAKSFRSVRFSAYDAAYLISKAKALFGGVVPFGYDVVYVLTSKDIQALGQSGVAGLADCLGGIRFRNRSFAVGELIAFEDLDAEVVTFYVDATARTAAHEIGHLLGGQHHLANCAEGVLTEIDQEATACTLMFNSLDLASKNFATPNAAIIRGHGAHYAAP